MPLRKPQTALETETRPFREIRASELDIRSLQDHIGAFGYALIRNLLFPRDVNLLLCEITQLASKAGFLQSDRDPLDRIVKANIVAGDSDPSLRRINEHVFDLEAFHSLPHHPTLRGMMEHIVGPHLLIHPKPIPRLVLPNARHFRFNPHRDYHTFGGDPQTYTAWIPLHDCPTKLGPLQIQEASHRLRLQKTQPGHSSSSSEATQGESWVGGRIDVGDVLVFSSLTVHAASPNTSTQLRICLDCRFQSYDRPINPANLVFLSVNGRSWHSTYAQWRSDQYKYYWKNLPLHLQPSPAELAAMAQSAELPEVRARCASILSQLQDPTNAIAMLPR